MDKMKRNIPFADLKPVNGMIREELIASFTDTLDKEWFIGGEKVKEFEELDNVLKSNLLSDLHCNIFDFSRCFPR